MQSRGCSAPLQLAMIPPRASEDPGRRDRAHMALHRQPGVHPKANCRPAKSVHLILDNYAAQAPEGLPLASGANETEESQGVAPEMPAICAAARTGAGVRRVRSVRF